VGRREVAGAAAFNGGGVAPMVVDQGGWVLQLGGDPGVRRRRSIEGKCSSEGRSPEGANSGDTRTESPCGGGAGESATRSTWRTGGPGRDRGPVISGWVRRGEAVGAALTVGVGSTVRPIWFSNRIKFILNGFKFAPNFDRSKRCLSLVQKF
jgi:hypothetical protein